MLALHPLQRPPCFVTRSESLLRCQTSEGLRGERNFENPRIVECHKMPFSRLSSRRASGWIGVWMDRRVGSACCWPLSKVLPTLCSNMVLSSMVCISTLSKTTSIRAGVWTPAMGRKIGNSPQQYRLWNCQSGNLPACYF
jgi:hypothetical protein